MHVKPGQFIADTPGNSITSTYELSAQTPEHQLPDMAALTKASIPDVHSLLQKA